jgi:integrase
MKVKYVYGNSRGGFKYMRDVPVKLQPLLARQRWEIGLGSDDTKATERATDLRREHDKLIADLKTDVGRQAFTERQTSEDNARKLQLASVLGDTLGQDAGLPVINKSAEVWRRTESIMAQARTNDPVKEWGRLALFAAYAFGDRTHIDRTPVDDATGNLLADMLTPARPVDPVGGAMWDALHGVLCDRLSEISPHVDPDSPDRIKNLIDPYAKANALKNATVDDYTKKVGRFVAVCGNLRASEITADHVQTFRDKLVVDGLEVSSVKGYLSGLSAVLGYAVDERLIKSNPARDVKRPRDNKSIEERKHLPFTPKQAAMVIADANRRWADNADSRLDPVRRKLYRLTTIALLYTGARPHELWRLTPADAGEHDKNGWQGRGLDIKSTKYGERLIPCPPIALPFADLVVAGGLNCLSPQGDRLPTEKEVAHMVKSFGGERQFVKMLVDLKIKRPRVSLYSTRGTFVSSIQNRVPDQVIENIIGHVGDKKMLRHYKSPTEMAEMLNAMGLVKYG